MDLRAQVLARAAGQLGHPRGLTGHLVGRFLNRGNRGMIVAAVAALPVSPDAAVADIGFGGGSGLGLLLHRFETEGSRVYGVEVSATMLAGAARRYRRQIASGRLQLRRASIDRLPLADSTLDGAISLNTIYFLHDLPQALAEMRRVLRPAGRLVLGVGDPRAMARMSVTQQGFLLRPVPDVIDALQLAGLVLCEHRRIGEADDAYHLLVVAAR